MVPLAAFLLQPLLQRLPLHVEFVQLLVDLLADWLPRGLPLLDGDAGLIEGVLNLLELLPELLGAPHA